MGSTCTTSDAGYIAASAETYAFVLTAALDLESFDAESFEDGAAKSALADALEGLFCGDAPFSEVLDAGARVAASLEASLRNLGAERLDAYLLHGPSSEARRTGALSAEDRALRERHRSGRRGNDAVDPDDVVFVMDSHIGQSAADQARAFKEDDVAWARTVASGLGAWMSG